MLISSLLGTDATPDAVLTALQANPEKLVELQKYELDNKLDLQKLQLADAQMYISDIQNARSRQIEHEKVIGGSDTNLYVLAWTIVTGFFGLIIAMIFITVPQDSSGVVFMLFGSLSAGFGSVIGYFFGSSKSSSDKTDHLVDIAKGTNAGK